MKLGKIVLGMCQTNCYFLYEDQSNDVIFIDPADQGKVIYDKMAEKGFQISAILLTHGHFDHILGCKELKELTNAKIYAYEGEEDLCMNVTKNVSADIGCPCTIKPDVLLKDGEILNVAGMTVKVIATPGHTGGSCCYYMEDEKILISGDTLFEGSVGRTDFPTGSMSTLVRSIKEKLMILPEDVVVYPGHGGSTTIGDEKINNPFL